MVNERGEMRLEDLPPPLVNEIRSTQRRYDARAAHRLQRRRCSPCLPAIPGHPFPAIPRYRYQEELDAMDASRDPISHTPHSHYRYQEELDAMSSDPYGLQFQALLQV